LFGVTCWIRGLIGMWGVVLSENSVRNSVTFFDVPQNPCKKWGDIKGGTVLTRREKFYVWEHETVGHVGWLEFCPKCFEGGK